jgi:hypothetical protein
LPLAKSFKLGILDSNKTSVSFMLFPGYPN